MDIKELQTLLKRKGFDPSAIDGIMGPKTKAALISFKKSIGFQARPYLGPLTKAALREGVIAAQPSENHPPWLRLAYGFLGLREIAGPTHNKKIISWWEALHLPFRDDETPWCAGFMNRVVQMAGLSIPSQYRAAALGWRWCGHGTQLDGPAMGAVFSITRPGKPGSGHTGFVAGRDHTEKIMILGGNQGNQVSINPYSPTARDAQYHWPEGYPLPEKTGLETLPQIDAAAPELKNEA